MTGHTDGTTESDGNGGLLAGLKERVSDAVDEVVSDAGGVGLYGIPAVAAGAGVAGVLGFPWFATVGAGVAGITTVAVNHGVRQYIGEWSGALHVWTALLTVGSMTGLAVVSAFAGAVDAAFVAGLSGAAGLVAQALRAR